MIVSSDTTPICYLLLIDRIEILPKLYGQVLIPTTVYRELADPKSPVQIRDWIQQLPQRLEVQTITPSSSIGFRKSDRVQVHKMIFKDSLANHLRL